MGIPGAFSGFRLTSPNLPGEMLQSSPFFQHLLSLYIFSHTKEILTQLVTGTPQGSISGEQEVWQTCRSYTLCLFFLFFCSSVSHCFMPWLESISFSSCSSVNLVLIFRETATGIFIKLTEGIRDCWQLHFIVSRLESEEFYTLVVCKCLKSLNSICVVFVEENRRRISFRNPILQ